MTELDKYKRRLIRSVSRLLIQEKKPEDEVWEMLSKETKCDCKLLWTRMRAITIKKIKRLLPVDDRPASIAHIARLSFTDWLLFDLVLVHEDIDVIDRDRMQEVKGQWKALMELFMLVQKYNVESLGGTALAEAWSSIAFVYNSNGRQCSPMMLQRRWYQLKELTRSNFYNLWFNYRGNQKLWDAAKQSQMPSKLQLAIARRYPNIVTQPFTEWEELIKQRKVILPDEFGTKVEKENESKSNAPDLIVIEPHIETIDLGPDSDSEETDQILDDNITENTETLPTPNDTTEENKETSNVEDLTIDVDLTTVKTEPEVDGLSNVQILNTTHLEDVDKDVDKRLEQQSQYLEAKRNLALQVSKFIDETEELDDNETPALETETIEDSSSNDGVVIEDDEVTDTTEELIKQKAIEYLNKTEKTNVTEPTPIEDSPDETLPQEDVNNSTDVISDTEELIKLKANEFLARTEKPNNSEILIEDEIDEMDDIIKQKAEDFVNKSDGKKVEVVAPDLNLPIDCDFVGDGVEFVDDGIEFMDDGIEYVEDDDESEADFPKPTQVKAVKQEAFQDPEINQPEDTVKFDLKLLMDPIVFTIKLDNLIAFKNNEHFEFRDKDTLDKIIAQNKPIKKSVIVKTEPEPVQTLTPIDNNDVIQTDGENVDDVYSDSDEDNVIRDDQKVKLSSHILQKPRCRNYNPILLCKNPDFNTRLKRLTTGFFCSPRNCQLIKACKPMTIDLDKAFERKLVNGTMYLKFDGITVQPVETDNHTEQTTSILPSAMPMQSLINNTKMDINALIASTSTTATKVYLNKKSDEEKAERNKVINLPDITEIRRINQKLLTAEVTPIQVHANDNVEVPLIDQPGQINKGNKIDRNSAEVQNLITRTPKSSTLLSSAVPISKGSWSSVPVSNVTVNSTPLPNIAPAYSKPGPASKLGRPKVKIDPSPPVFSKPGPASRQGRPKVKKDPSPLPRKNKVPYTVYSQLTRGPLAWNQPKPLSTHSNDDFLLTIDTLNKMIVKLSGYDESVHSSTYKKKKAPWVVSEPDEVKEQQQKEQIEKEDNINEEKTKKQEKIMEEKAKKEENVKNKDLREEAANKKPRKRKYCCWCQEKLEKLSRKGRMHSAHKCPLPVCHCCCRDLFIDTLKKQNMKNATLMQGYQTNMSSSIESVVQQSGHVNQSCQTVPTTPTPCIRVRQSTDLSGDSSSSIPSTSNDSSGKALVEAILNTDLAQTLVVETGTNVGFNYEAEADESTSIVSQEIVVNTDRSNEKKNTEFNSDKLRPVLRINITTSPPPSKSKMYVPVATQKLINASAGGGTEKQTVPLLQNLNINSDVRKNPESETQGSIYPILVPSKPESERQGCIYPMLVPSKPVSRESTASIVLDGSKSCPIPQTVVRDDMKLKPIAPKPEKVIFLDTKNIGAKPSECPIYLGKNKILLTTTKLPKHVEKVQEKNQNAVVAPTIPLPQGVSIVVTPNGELTYTLESGINLDEAQTAAIPNILAAVTQQLNSNIPPLIDTSANVPPLSNIDSGSVIEIGDDENSTEKLVKSTEKSNDMLAKCNDVTDDPVMSKSSTGTENTSVTSEDSIEHSKNREVKKFNEEKVEGKEILASNKTAKDIHTNDEQTLNSENNISLGGTVVNTEVAEPKTSSVPSELNSSNDSNKIIKINEHTESFNKNLAAHTNKKEEKSGETGMRSLLSDLMEMSGISAEDTTPTQEISSQTVDTMPTINFCVGAETDPATGKPLHNIIPSLGVPYPSDDVVNLPELSPVTSLDELKYAYENNGSFFKLDLDTGLIAPIHVHMKKNKKKNFTTPTLKAVIDLTDDADATQANSTNVKTVQPSPAPQDFRKQYTRIKPKILHSNKVLKKAECVKPLKLFKAIHPHTMQTITLSVNKSHIKRKRKDTPDVRIDMIDSDEPMEEEYLDESFDSDFESAAYRKTIRVSTLADNTQTSNRPNSEDSDDSDDEPLAKKIKRKMAQEENIANKEIGPTTNKELDLTQQNAQTPVAEMEAEAMDMPIGTPLQEIDSTNASIEERDPTPALDFLDGDSDESTDDCILGF